MMSQWQHSYMLQLIQHSKTEHRNQWDTGTPIHYSEKSGQKWSSWKNCGPRALPLTCKQGQVTQLYIKNIGSGVQKNNSRFSRLLSKNLKHLAVAHGSLLAEGLESRTVMSVCRQQWNMVDEVPDRSSSLSGTWDRRKLCASVPRRIDALTSIHPPCLLLIDKNEP